VTRSTTTSPGLVALVLATIVTVGACGAGPHYAVGTPAVRVLAKSGCPKAIAGDHDVKNEGDAHGSTLLPSLRPTGGIVCGYKWTYPPARLQESRRLDVARARTLAAVINRIHLGQASGMTNCPMDTGLVRIFVFTYRAAPDVDLWWKADGCQTLDNGFRIGIEGGNPSFYDDFYDEVQNLALSAPTFGRPGK
jgi:hypothetical protein